MDPRQDGVLPESYEGVRVCFMLGFRDTLKKISIDFHKCRLPLCGRMKLGQWLSR